MYFRVIICRIHRMTKWNLWNGKVIYLLNVVRWMEESPTVLRTCGVQDVVSVWRHLLQHRQNSHCCPAVSHTCLQLGFFRPYVSLRVVRRGDGRFSSKSRRITQRVVWLANDTPSVWGTFWRGSTSSLSPSRCSKLRCAALIFPTTREGKVFTATSTQTVDLLWLFPHRCYLEEWNSTEASVELAYCVYLSC